MSPLITIVAIAVIASCCHLAAYLLNKYGYKEDKKAFYIGTFIGGVISYLFTQYTLNHFFTLFFSYFISFFIITFGITIFWSRSGPMLYPKKSRMSSLEAGGNFMEYSESDRILFRNNYNRITDYLPVSFGYVDLAVICKYKIYFPAKTISILYDKGYFERTGDNNLPLALYSSADYDGEIQTPRLSAESQKLFTDCLEYLIDAAPTATFKRLLSRETANDTILEELVEVKEKLSQKLQETLDNKDVSISYIDLDFIILKDKKISYSA